MPTADGAPVRAVRSTALQLPPDEASSSMWLCPAVRYTIRAAGSWPVRLVAKPKGAPRAAGAPVTAVRSTALQLPPEGRASSSMWRPAVRYTTRAAGLWPLRLVAKPKGAKGVLAAAGAPVRPVRSLACHDPPEGRASSSMSPPAVRYTTRAAGPWPVRLVV